MDITKAIANALEARDSREVLKRSSSSQNSEYILQLNAHPLTISGSDYSNARSNSNPNGSLTTLYKLRDLVDPVPLFGKSYLPSSASTESVYDNILNGALIFGESSFTMNILSVAKKDFEEDKFANMDGTPGFWRPVYTAPEDWPTAGIDRYKSMNLDFNSQQQSSSIKVVPGENQLSLNSKTGLLKSLNSKTKINSINLKYMLVELRRPWFNSLLFDSNGWYLDGQNSGFCSSGSDKDNSGAFPLIPTSMLLVKSAEVNCEWSSEDKATIDEFKTKGEEIFLGPFKLGDDSTSNDDIQIAGWISEVVPLSPKDNPPKATTIQVENNGGFIIKFSVDYSLGGKKSTLKSDNFPILSKKSIEVPAGAYNVGLKIEVMTFPKPVETWKTVKDMNLDYPQDLDFTISGTTWNIKVKEN